MGQTAAETKREIAETRAQLEQTLAALQTKAHDVLDWRASIRRRPWLGVALAGTATGLLLLAALRLSPASPWRRRRRSMRDLLPTVKLKDLRLQRVTRRSAGAQARREAERAPARSQGAQEAATRRILVRAAEAGASALAAGLVKILIERARQPRGSQVSRPPASARDGGK